MASKNKTYVAHGDLAIPAIALAATRTVDVLLSAAMPDTNYDVFV